MAFLLRKCEVEEDLKNPGLLHCGTGATFFPHALVCKCFGFLVHKARNTIFNKLKTLRIGLTNVYQTHKQSSYQMMYEQECKGVCQCSFIYPVKNRFP